MAESYSNVDYLKYKIKSWTPEKALEFHGSAEKAYPYKADYIWEEANTEQVGGFMHYGPKFAAYYCATGEEFVLTSDLFMDQFEVDWKSNIALYNYGKETGKIRSVNPVGFKIGGIPNSYNTLDVDGVTFVYYRIMHPNSEFGLTTTIGIPNDQKLKYFVDNITLLFESVTYLKSTGQVTGYPSTKLPWLLTDSIGPYWRHFYHWTMSADGVFAKVMGELQKFSQQLEKIGVTVDPIIETQARTAWKKALNI